MTKERKNIQKQEECERQEWASKEAEKREEILSKCNKDTVRLCNYDQKEKNSGNGVEDGIRAGNDICSNTGE